MTKMTLQMTEANTAPLRCPTATALDKLPGTMSVDDSRKVSLPASIGFSAKIISTDKDDPDAAVKGIVVFDIGKKLQLSATENGESVDRLFNNPVVSKSYQNRAKVKSKMRLSVQLARQRSVSSEPTTPRGNIDKDNTSYATQESNKTSQKIAENQGKEAIHRKDSSPSKTSSFSSPESTGELSVQTDCFINDRQFVLKLIKLGKEHWEQPNDFDATPVQRNITKAANTYGKPTDTRQNNRYRTILHDTNLKSNSLSGWEVSLSRAKTRTSETQISSRAGRRHSLIPSPMTFDGRPRSNVQERYSTLYGTPSPSDNYKFFHYADLRLYMKQYRRNHVCGAADRAGNLDKYEAGLYRLDEATESLFYKANCAINDGFMLGLQSAPGTPMHSRISKNGFCLPLAYRQKLTRPKTMSSSDENTLTHTMYVRQNGTFSRMWKTRDDGIQDPSIVIKQPPRTPQNLKNISSTDPQICKSVLVQSLVNLFLCCVVLIGISLVIYSKRNFSFVGANLLCVSIPTLICRVLYAAYDVIVYCRHERRSRALRVIPGIVLFAGGFWILCFHLLTIMFINPQISTMVLGKIDLIQWIQVSLVLLPLVIGPIYKARLQMETRPRSTSNGPLLSSPSGHSERNMFENECRKRSKFQETTRKHICPRKRFEYARSSSSFVILAFTAIVLMVKFIPSNSNTPCNMISPTAVCNRTNPVGNIRVVSWNILLGHQMNGRSNLNEIAGFLNEYNPHFIGLQEANGLPAYWGGRDVFRYLQKSLSSCTEVTEGINPKRSWLGVGIISRIPIIKQWNEFLPEKKGARLPHYSVSKVTGEIGDGCAQINDFGSGNDVGHLTEVRKRRIHIYSLHAVYKNWTCPRSSNLSYQHMKFVHDNVALLPPEDPVIVLGDMNINPWEKELDVWFNSELGFKSALWPDRNNWESRRSINKSANCTEDSLDISNNKNNCKCSNEWSDPPRSTLLNRKAAVDHIFYRGLELLEARIVNKTGRISDHFPVIAEFALTPL